jgi:hypothetical protein
MALRTKDGNTLWHTGIGTMANPPITYLLDGNQYILLGGDGGLFAFKLPEKM